MSRTQKLAYINIFIQLSIMVIGTVTGVYSLVSFGAAIGAIVYMSKDVLGEKTRSDHL